MNRLWDQARSTFAQTRVFARAQRLAWSALACLGRHTITGLIPTAGRQFVDWSADYRLFERGRVEVARLLAVPRQAVLQLLAPEDPWVVLLDDTILPNMEIKSALEEKRIIIDSVPLEPFDTTAVDLCQLGEKSHPINARNANIPIIFEMVLPPTPNPSQFQGQEHPAGNI